MKKNYAAVAIAAVLVVSLATVTVYLQNHPSPASSGQLVIMGTDPPVRSQGVSQANAHYRSAQAHKSGSDMSSGWVQVSGSGTLDLMATGTAQSLATSKVDAGAYDAFRFNVDSVKVVYNGQEYLATVASTTVTAQSESRVFVNETSRAVALIDMRSFIINTGNDTRPQLVFSATAEATVVPPSSLVSLSLQVGNTVSLSGSWWVDFQARTSTNVAIGGTLSASTLQLTLQNSGGADAEVQEVIVTPVSASVFASSTLPASLTGSAIFSADGSGALQSSTSLQGSALLSGGTRIASDSSSTLTYTGTISGIVPGQQYMVTTIGANTYSSAVVVAG